jgi:transposase
MKSRTTRMSGRIPTAAVLYMAFELGQNRWRVRFGDGSRTREIEMRARDLERLNEEVAKARRRFGLPAEVRLLSCYEAGRDGFWLHRYLASQGVENLVVDSASIEVKRHRRRVKTDRVDVGKLLQMLIRYDHGERKVWSVVRVPDAEAEDWRQIHREIERLKKEAAQHRMRIQSLLITQGISVTVGRHFRRDLEGYRLWDGTELSRHLKRALIREHERLELVERQRREIEALRRRVVAEQPTEALSRVAMMQRLCGIGINGAWVFGMEFFGWRHFHNRREVGAAAGLTPTPYASGDTAREQGISKAGNRRVRWLIVELAWCWLRYQPESRLCRWYRERFAGGGKRLRRIGIVAVARRLLIDLWRYVEYGVVPEGAKLKAA